MNRLHVLLLVLVGALALWFFTNSPEKAPLTQVTQTENPTTATSKENRIVIATTTDGRALWSKDADTVYDLDGNPVPAADPTTFIALFNTLGGKTNYAKDKAHVFYSYTPTKILDSADPATFFVQADSRLSNNGVDFFAFEYGKDKNHVYAGPTILPGVDAQTFQPVPNSFGSHQAFFKDKFHVYTFDASHLNIVDQADPLTFTALTPFGDSVVEDSDGGYSIFFRYASYGKDSRHVFMVRDGSEVSSRVIPDADPQTFVLYPSPNVRNQTWVERLAHDKNHAYIDGNVIPGADVATFEFITDKRGDIHFARDKGSVYDLSNDFEYGSPLGMSCVRDVCKLLNSDPATFVLLTGYSDGYLKDKKNVWYTAKRKTSLISGADGSTFTLVEPLPKVCANSDEAGPIPGCYDAQDASHKYFEGSIVQ